MEKTNFPILNRIPHLLISNMFNVWELRNGYHKYHKYSLLRNAFEYSYYRKLHDYGSWIDINVKMETIPLFMHDLYGIFISGGASIGRNCTIFQHVTIGSNLLSNSKGFGAPKIGDNVLIGAGAKLIGNVSIGNNCRIGANCIVNFDMPDNCTAVMQTARLIQKENLNNKF